MPAFARGNATFSSNFRPHCIRNFLWDASWRHEHRARSKTNLRTSLCASRSTDEQHAAPTAFAVTASLVSCYGNYRGICTSKKKKVKKELNAYRPLAHSSCPVPLLPEQSHSAALRL